MKSPGKSYRKTNSRKDFMAPPLSVLKPTTPVTRASWVVCVSAREVEHPIRPRFDPESGFRPPFPHPSHSRHSPAPKNLQAQKFWCGRVNFVSYVMSLDGLRILPPSRSSASGRNHNLRKAKAARSAAHPRRGSRRLQPHFQRLEAQ
jgi:hypothetical protein